jgi:hypothetical protein
MANSSASVGNGVTAESVETGIPTLKRSAAIE